jgi:hypothetical protein
MRHRKQKNFVVLMSWLMFEEPRGRPEQSNEDDGVQELRILTEASQRGTEEQTFVNEKTKFKVNSYRLARARRHFRCRISYIQQRILGNLSETARYNPLHRACMCVIACPVNHRSTAIITLLENRHQ